MMAASVVNALGLVTNVRNTSAWRFFVGYRPKLHFVKLNGQKCLGIGIGGGMSKL